MPTPAQINSFFEFASQQLYHMLASYPDRFPMYTTRGKWDVHGESWTNWCEGFLCGQLWLLYQHTNEPTWREKAEHYCRLIEPRKTDRTVHDLGFLFWPSWKRWYDLSGDPALNAVVIQAGQTLALRYREKGGYLCSFLGEESLFIDIMMNVGIIFYAAGQLGDQNLERIAHQHCMTTRKYLVRGDGSTVHEGIFDLQTGQFLQHSSQQGWRPDSSWARGLAWALYGFSTVYEMTADARFLATAELCAGYYLEHTPQHGVPPNDWDEPHPTTSFESSAAAIAASGLLDLARLCPDADRSKRYRQASLRILDTLCTPEFLAAFTPDWEGLLKHGIYHQRKGLGVDESVMWGDYFLMEAMSKVSHEQ
jgi:unsaturated chondroitin disaccharide hydrolase